MLSGTTLRGSRYGIYTANTGQYTQALGRFHEKPKPPQILRRGCICDNRRGHSKNSSGICEREIDRLDQLHRCAVQEKALSESLDPGSVGKLIDLIPECKEGAIQALGRIGPKAAEALPIIRKSFEKKKSEWKHRTMDLPYCAESLAIERISGCTKEQPSGEELLFDVFARSRRAALKGAEGVNSSIRTPFATVITNDKDWRDLWSRHGAHPTCRPKIDFSKQIVIATFRGDTTATESLSLGGFEEATSSITFRYYDGFSDALSEAPVSPFMFVWVTRPKKRLVVIEQRYWAMSSAKPVETEVAHYEPRN